MTATPSPTPPTLPEAVALELATLRAQVTDLQQSLAEAREREQRLWAMVDRAVPAPRPQKPAAAPGWLLLSAAGVGGVVILWAVLHLAGLL